MSSAMNAMNTAANENLATPHFPAREPSLADLVCRPIGWLPQNLLPGHSHRTAAPVRGGYSTGFPEIDDTLPDSGWPRSGMVEVVSRQNPGVEELQLLLPLMRSIIAQGKRVLWVSPPCAVSDPARLQAGIDAEQLSMIAAGLSCQDFASRIEQALTAPEYGLVLVWSNYFPGGFLRRLERAGEVGKSLTVLFRRRAGKFSQPSLREQTRVYSADGVDLPDVELILTRPHHTLRLVADRHA